MKTPGHLNEKTKVISSESMFMWAFTGVDKIYDTKNFMFYFFFILKIYKKKFQNNV